LSMFVAMGPPILPVPTNPICMMTPGGDCCVF
jgi:hypothetical protein